MSFVRFALPKIFVRMKGEENQAGCVFSAWAFDIF